MKNRFASRTLLLGSIIAISSCAMANHHMELEKQRDSLAKNTDGKGFGPQSPRDIGKDYGTNKRVFGTAPHRKHMNLCNIHFHAGAEHKGGEFTTFAGPGDGKGYGSGYVYNEQLDEALLKPVDHPVCAGKGASLKPGDTIEVHYVFSAADVAPGPTLGACLSDSTSNPGLRVEGQVFVLANDESAHDFAKLADIMVMDGYHQAPNIPDDTGEPVVYLGSTTGPSYNEQGSPLQVTWSVRPEVEMVNIHSLAKWCDDNVFDEDHAHGVRNLVVNPALLSPIQ